MFNLTFCGRPVSNPSEADLSTRQRLIARAEAGERNPVEGPWGLQLRLWKANGDTITIKWEHLQ